MLHISESHIKRSPEETKQAAPAKAVLEDMGKAASPMTSLTRLRSSRSLSFTPYTRSSQPSQPTTMGGTGRILGRA